MGKNPPDIRTWRAKLNKKIGESIFLTTHRDFVSGQMDNRRPSLFIAKAFAVLIIATPFLLFIAAILLFASDFPNLVAIVLGIVMAIASWMILPRRLRFTNPPYRRDDLPMLFALTDRITAQLGTEPLTSIQFDTEMNGYVFEARHKGQRERILGIGLVLWESHDDAEKLAFLGHEIAHLVNNDPARGTLLAMGMDTLGGWLNLLSPTRIYNAGTNIVTEYSHEADVAFFALLPRLAVEFSMDVLRRLSFLASQRAEYLADALGAQISGIAPAISALHKLDNSEVLYKEMLGMQPSRDTDGAEFLARLGAIICDVDADTQATILARNTKNLATTDISHPPTAYRSAFLQLLRDHPFPDPITDTNFAAINDELLPIRQKLGREMVMSMQVQ